jgi:hypothetical protein
MIANAERQYEKDELIACRAQVLAHNAKITREWQELTSFTHAFHSHIHDQILKEQPPPAPPAVEPQKEDVS